MLKKKRLFTPGPTPLLPAAQVAMAAANMHHRTAEFRQLYTRTLADLKEFIGTANDVLLLASSGTGAMEAAVTNLTSPGDKVVVLTAGKFGERSPGVGELGLRTASQHRPHQSQCCDQAAARKTGFKHTHPTHPTPKSTPGLGPEWLTPGKFGGIYSRGNVAAPRLTTASRRTAIGLNF